MSIYVKTKMEAMPGSCTECKYGDQYGCVGDVKCRILREYFTGNVEPPYKERPDECPLVEQLEPPNDPLTLEELLDMDGEPVWIERIGSDSPEDKEWALVFVKGGICRTSDCSHALFEFYGKTWLAYRRKPGGEEYGRGKSMQCL